MLNNAINNVINKFARKNQLASQVNVPAFDVARLLVKYIPFIVGFTKNDERLYMYDPSIRHYTDKTKAIEDMISQIFPDYKHRNLQDIETNIRKHCRNNGKDINLSTYQFPYYLAVCANGLYDRLNHKLIPSNYSHFITYSINTPLISKEEFNRIKNIKLIGNQTVGQFVEDRINLFSDSNSGIKKQLWQVILRCIEPGCSDKCVFLYGSQSTGKSSFFKYDKSCNW